MAGSVKKEIVDAVVSLFYNYKVAYVA